MLQYMALVLVDQGEGSCVVQVWRGFGFDLIQVCVVLAKLVRWRLMKEVEEIALGKLWKWYLYLEEVK